jgi:hypothetical protein
VWTNKLSRLNFLGNKKLSEGFIDEVTSKVEFVDTHSKDLEILSVCLCFTWLIMYHKMWFKMKLPGAALKIKSAVEPCQYSS